MGGAKIFDHSSGKRLKVGSAKIYFEQHGDISLPVILFLHGALGSIEDFNGIISKIPANTFRILGIDNRGHGKSTLGTEHLNYELLQYEIEAVLRHLNIRKLIIIGFSNGGTLAYRLASNSNLEIEKLITIGSPWASKHTEHLHAFFSALTSEIWKLQCPADYEKLKKLNPECDFDRVFQQMINMALDTGPKGRPNFHVKNILCPVLALRGENDSVVSHQNLNELTTLVQRVDAITIPKAGHEIFSDQLEVLMGYIKSFLCIE
ncbi:MAG TPA: alpha/beta hydrolase [Gammaproteobacteria bacterium]|nr:alpha/beta hydrolase [Gammaproteobacteria bacterium]